MSAFLVPLPVRKAMNSIQHGLTAFLFIAVLGGTAYVPQALAQENEPGADAQPAATETPQKDKDAAAAAQPVFDDRLPRIELSSKILYQALLAEIAGSRGSIVLATGTYLDLAKSTRDPRIARRAVEVALYAREPDTALEAVQIWVAADPESPLALQTAAAILLEMRRADDAEPYLAKFLTIEIPPGRTELGDGSARGEALRMGPSIPASLGDRLENIARALLRYPDKPAAKRLIEHLTAPHEKHAEAHFARAMVYAGIGEFPRAEDAIDLSLALDPDREESVILKAQLQQRRDASLATETLRKFIDAHARANEARLAYARALIGENRYEEARREFSKLLEERKDDGEMLFAVALLSMQLGDREQAGKHFRRLLELNYGNPNLLRFYLGQIAEEARQPEEALDWYGKVMPGEQYLPAVSRAATILARQGRIEDGRALLRKAALAVPRERQTLLIAEAQMLAEVGRNIEGFDLIDKELASHPEEPDLLYETALMAEKLDRIDVLERNLRTLIRLTPDDPRGYNALGYSLADRNQRLDEAQQLIDKALSLSPNDAYIIDSKGWLLYRRGDASAALETLRKAFGLRQDAEIAAHLGEVLWMLGQRDEARKTWEAAVRQHPANPVLTDTLRKFKP